MLRSYLPKHRLKGKSQRLSLPYYHALDKEARKR